MTILITTATLLSGCKKNSDKSSHCLLTSFSSGNVSGTIQYNQAGKVSRVTTPQSINSISYQGDSFLIIHADSGVITSKTYGKLNASGLASAVRTETLQDNKWTRILYEYDGAELSRAITTTSDDNTPSIVEYLWTNGNMTAAVAGKDTSFLSYYTDKAFQPGDYYYLYNLISGYETVRNKNLLRTVSGSIDFVYEWGTNGKISTMRYTAGTSLSFIDYGYDCN